VDLIFAAHLAAGSRRECQLQDSAGWRTSQDDPVTVFSDGFFRGL